MSFNLEKYIDSLDVTKNKNIVTPEKNKPFDFNNFFDELENNSAMSHNDSSHSASTPQPVADTGSGTSLKQNENNANIKMEHLPNQSSNNPKNILQKEALKELKENNLEIIPVDTQNIKLKNEKIEKEQLEKMEEYIHFNQDREHQNYLMLMDEQKKNLNSVFRGFKIWGNSTARMWLGMSKALGGGFLDPDLDNKIEDIAKNKTTLFHNDQLEKGFTGLLKDKQYALLFDYALGTALEQTPQRIIQYAGLMSGTAPVLRSVMSSGMLSLSSMGNKFHEIQDEDIPEEMKYFNAILTGLSDFAIEMSGNYIQLGALDKVFKNNGKEFAKTHVNSYLKKRLLKDVTETVTELVLPEFFEEFFQELSENVIDIASGIKDRNEIFDGVIEAGVAGLASSLVLGAGPSGLEIYNARNTNKALSKFVSQYEKAGFKPVLQNNNDNIIVFSKSDDNEIISFNLNFETGEIFDKKITILKKDENENINIKRIDENGTSESILNTTELIKEINKKNIENEFNNIKEISEGVTVQEGELTASSLNSVDSIINLLPDNLIKNSKETDGVFEYTLNNDKKLIINPKAEKIEILNEKNSFVYGVTNTKDNLVEIHLLNNLNDDNFTAYHESFHFIENLFLTDDDIAYINVSFNLDSDISDDLKAEKRADLFALYMIDQNKFNADMQTKNIFKKMYLMLKNWYEKRYGKKITNDLFERIKNKDINIFNNNLENLNKQQFNKNDIIKITDKKGEENHNIGFGKGLREAISYDKLYRNLSLNEIDKILSKTRTDEETSFSTPLSKKLFQVTDDALIVLKPSERKGLYYKFDADSGQNMGYDEFRYSFSKKDFDLIDSIVLNDDLYNMLYDSDDWDISDEEFKNKYKNKFKDYTDKRDWLSDIWLDKGLNLYAIKKSEFNKNNDNIQFLKAYHGGHDFDKFSTNHIGTGEGNQAFGWGLYFSDSENIAKSYQQYVKDFNELSGNLNLKFNNNIYHSSELIHIFLNALPDKLQDIYTINHNTNIFTTFFGSSKNYHDNINDNLVKYFNNEAKILDDKIQSAKFMKNFKSYVSNEFSWFVTDSIMTDFNIDNDEYNKYNKIIFDKIYSYLNKLSNNDNFKCLELKPLLEKKLKNYKKSELEFSIIKNTLNAIDYFYTNDNYWHSEMNNFDVRIKREYNNRLFDYNSLFKKYDSAKFFIDYFSNKDNSISLKSNLKKTAVYEVDLHSNKKIEDLNYLNWYEKPDEKIINNISKHLEKENIFNHNNFDNFADYYYNYYFNDLEIENENNIKSLYNILSKNVFKSDKEASLFLNRAGFDGIRYPANSISGNASENTFNYVIFDENNISINKKTQFNKKTIDSLNPSEHGIFQKYNPEKRYNMSLGKNITTLDITSKSNPDKVIDIYRGANKSQNEIVPGDFITTNKQLAKDYAGSIGHVISKKVKISDILDDVTEPLGEEYIYYPKNFTKTQFYRTAWTDENSKPVNLTNMIGLKNKTFNDINLWNSAKKQGNKNHADLLVKSIIDNKKHLLDNYFKNKNPENIIVAYSGKPYKIISNQIPIAFADYLYDTYKLSKGMMFAQNEVNHTNIIETSDRALNSPLFSGEVEKGKHYIIVDDVLTSGNTYASLKGYIENNGGIVDKFFTLASGRSKYLSNLKPDKTILDKIKTVFGKDIDNILKLIDNDLNQENMEGLTNAEAHAIFRDAQKLKKQLRKRPSSDESNRRHKTLPERTGKQLGHGSIDSIETQQKSISDNDTGKFNSQKNAEEQGKANKTGPDLNNKTQFNKKFYSAKELIELKKAKDKQRKFKFPKNPKFDFKMPNNLPYKFRKRFNNVLNDLVTGKPLNEKNLDFVNKNNAWIITILKQNKDLAFSLIENDKIKAISDIMKDNNYNYSVALNEYNKIEKSKFFDENIKLPQEQIDFANEQFDRDFKLMNQTTKDTHLNKIIRNQNRIIEKQKIIKEKALANLTKNELSLINKANDLKTKTIDNLINEKEFNLEMKANKIKSEILNNIKLLKDKKESLVNEFNKLQDLMKENIINENFNLDSQDKTAIFEVIKENTELQKNDNIQELNNLEPPKKLFMINKTDINGYETFMQKEYDKLYLHTNDETIERIKQTKQELEKISKSVLADIIEPISSRIKKISPVIYDKLMKFEYELSRDRYNRLKASEPYVIKYNKLEPRIQAVLDLALKNSDTKTINEIHDKYNLTEEYKKVRLVLNEIFREAKEVEFDNLKMKSEYFPRVIKNYENFTRYMSEINKVKYGEITVAIANFEKEAGYKPDELQIANIIKNMLISRDKNRIGQGEIGNYISRQIWNVEANMNKYYYNSAQALHHYINSATHRNHVRKFFGYEKVEITKNYSDLFSLPNAITELISQNKIHQSNESVLLDLLNARLSYKASPKFVENFKNINHLTLITNFKSALTQLEEISLAFLYSSKHALPELAKTIAGKSKIKMSDLGLDSVGAEFRTDDKLSKFVETSFKLTFFNTFDSIGKQTVLNTVFDKYSEKANKNKFSDKEKAELFRIYGSDYDSVISDLANKTVSDNVKLLLFSELSKVQPVSLSETPYVYLKYPGARLSYQYKTFMLKRFDMIKTKYQEDFVKAKTKKERMKAFLGLMHLATVLMIGGLSADYIKDFFYSRVFDIPDSVIDTILRNMMWSKYQYYEFKRYGLKSLGALIVPPLAVYENFIRDLSYTNKQLWNKQKIDWRTFYLWQNIPVIGKDLFWRFGKGHDWMMDDIIKKEKDLNQGLFFEPGEPKKQIPYQPQLNIHRSVNEYLNKDKNKFIEY